MQVLLLCNDFRAIVSYGQWLYILVHTNSLMLLFVNKNLPKHRDSVTGIYGIVVRVSLGLVNYRKKTEDDLDHNQVFISSLASQCRGHWFVSCWSNLTWHSCLLAP